MHPAGCAYASLLTSNIKSPCAALHQASVQSSSCAYLQGLQLGKRRWSYNQCELVLHQDDACGPGNVLAAAGAVYKKESDLQELCTDPEGQVCEIEHAALTITQLTPGMLPVNVHELVA